MHKPIHVCILTTAHPVDDVRVNNKFAYAFHTAGFRVTWVGPQHTYFDHTHYNRAGIEFVLSAPSRGRLDRLLRTSRRIRALAAKLKDVDVYYTPDPDSAFIAAAMAKDTGARLVFDIHELYHKAHICNWLPPAAVPIGQWLIRKMIARVCTKCNLVVGVSDGVLAPYYDCAQEAMVVRNCAPARFAAGPPADVCGPARNSFTMMHGKSSSYGGTSAVLRALALAAPHVSGLRVIMFEWFERSAETDRAELAARIEHLCLTELVDLRKPVQFQAMPEILRSCDVGLISHGRILEAGTQPNRAYEYMAIGLPVLVPLYDKGIATVIKTEKCGILVDAEKPQSIADAIIYLKENPFIAREMGRRAREAFLARHTWEVEVKPLLDKVRSWFPGRG